MMVRPLCHRAKEGGRKVTQIREQALAEQMAALLRGEPTDGELCLSGETVYGWRLIRWESDIPLTDQQRPELLAAVEACMRSLGAAAGVFSEEGDELTVLLGHTRFPARVHRDTAVWLCCHALMEKAAVALEREGTMFVGEEFAQAVEWREHAEAMPEISDWWAQASSMNGAAAHQHRISLQTAIKRRQYAVLGGYITRALREEAEPGRVCFAFVPLVIEAVWSQHAELSLEKLTEALNLQEMARRP